MDPVLRHVTAALALVALLACSSAGTCWLRVVASTEHDCCAQDATMQEPAQPCGSTAVAVASVELAAPALAAHIPLLLPSLSAHASGGSVSAASDHVLDPPLILRI